MIANFQQHKSYKKMIQCLIKRPIQGTYICFGLSKIETIWDRGRSGLRSVFKASRNAKRIVLFYKNNNDGVKSAASPIPTIVKLSKLKPCVHQWISDWNVAEQCEQIRQSESDAHQYTTYIHIHLYMFLVFFYFFFIFIYFS